MIPIRDSQWRSTTPHVTRALLVINILVFLYMLTLSDAARSGVLIVSNDALEQSQLSPGQPWPSSPSDDFTLRFGAVPEFITGELQGRDLSHDFVEDARLTGEGRLVQGRGINLLDGALLLLTPLTAMFLHAGWFHLIFNMLFLWVFGDNVEDRMGHTRFAIFYGITGYAAVAAHIWIDAGDLAPLVGASGAIFGVMGAYLILFPRALVQVFIFFFPMVLPAWLLIGGYFLLNVFTGFQSIVGDTTGGGGTAWFAHIGGFLAGIVLIYPFLIGRWRAPVGEIAPQWNLPVGMRARFRAPPGLRGTLRRGESESDEATESEVSPGADTGPEGEESGVQQIDVSQRPLLFGEPEPRSRRLPRRLPRLLPRVGRRGSRFKRRHPGGVDDFRSFPDRDPPE